MPAAAVAGGGPIARAITLLRGRSLGARLVLTLTGIGLVGSLVISLLLVGMITPSFRALEHRVVQAQVERTRAALAESGTAIRSAAGAFAVWNADDDRPPRTAGKEGFSPPAMAELGVNGMALLDRHGQVVIARWIDGAGRDDPARRAVLATATAGGALGLPDPAGGTRTFFIRLQGEVAAVAVAPVRSGRDRADASGYLVMARAITPERLSALLQVPGVALGTPAHGVVEASAQRMVVAVPLPGADGQPVASVRVPIARDVSRLGRRMLLLTVAASTLLLLLLLLMLRRTVSRVVLEPLERVERHMHQVRASGALVLLGEEERQDEIGSLERSLNAMLRQLHDLREQIEAQSFALGRSESAVAVMHNVRNALNPVSTILSHGLRQAPAVERALMQRAAEELAQADVPDARRRKLAAFVQAGIEAGEAARVEQLRQLSIGREAMAHVLDIIGEQQALAHDRPQLAEVDVTEVIARHATIARYADGCSIALSFPAQPMQALANRVMLSQVIGNLFANAAESIVAAGRNSGSIAVTIAREDDAVVIRIRDDGEGFAPEAAAMLFHRDFSTRAHKSGGLGLHWCANSMTAMQGALALISEGRGLGATAVLTLRPAPATMPA